MSCDVTMRQSTKARPWETLQHPQHVRWLLHCPPPLFWVFIPVILILQVLKLRLRELRHRTLRDVGVKAGIGLWSPCSETPSHDSFLDGPQKRSHRAPACLLATHVSALCPFLTSSGSLRSPPLQISLLPSVQHTSSVLCPFMVAPGETASLRV